MGGDGWDDDFEPWDEAPAASCPPPAAAPPSQVTRLSAQWADNWGNEWKEPQNRPTVAPRALPAPETAPSSKKAVVPSPAARPDPNGVEPLPGESEAQYIARQARLKEEAAARMRAKFGASGGLAGRMGGVGSSGGPVGSNPKRTGGLWSGLGSIAGSVAGIATGLAQESVSGFVQLASDVSGSKCLSLNAGSGTTSPAHSTASSVHGGSACNLTCSEASGANSDHVPASSSKVQATCAPLSSGGVLASSKSSTTTVAHATARAPVGDAFGNAGFHRPATSTGGSMSDVPNPARVAPCTSTKQPVRAAIVASASGGHGKGSRADRDEWGDGSDWSDDDNWDPVPTPQPAGNGVATVDSTSSSGKRALSVTSQVAASPPSHVLSATPCGFPAGGRPPVLGALRPATAASIGPSCGVSPLVHPPPNLLRPVDQRPAAAPLGASQSGIMLHPHAATKMLPRPGGAQMIPPPSMSASVAGITTVSSNGTVSPLKGPPSAMTLPSGQPCHTILPGEVQLSMPPPSGSPPTIAPPTIPPRAMPLPITRPPQAPPPEAPPVSGLLLDSPACAELVLKGPRVSAPYTHFSPPITPSSDILPPSSNAPAPAAPQPHALLPGGALLPDPPPVSPPLGVSQSQLGPPSAPTSIPTSEVQASDMPISEQVSHSTSQPSTPAETPAHMLLSAAQVESAAQLDEALHDDECGDVVEEGMRNSGNEDFSPGQDAAFEVPNNAPAAAASFGEASLNQKTWASSSTEHSPAARDMGSSRTDTWSDGWNSGSESERHQATNDDVDERGVFAIGGLERIHRPDGGYAGQEVKTDDAGCGPGSRDALPALHASNASFGRGNSHEMDVFRQAISEGAPTDTQAKGVDQGVQHATSTSRPGSEIVPHAPSIQGSEIESSTANTQVETDARHLADVPPTTGSGNHGSAHNVIGMEAAQCTTAMWEAVPVEAISYEFSAARNSPELTSVGQQVLRNSTSLPDTGGVCLDASALDGGLALEDADTANDRLAGTAPPAVDLAAADLAGFSDEPSAVGESHMTNAEQVSDEPSGVGVSPMVRTRGAIDESSTPREPSIADVAGVSDEPSAVGVSQIADPDSAADLPSINLESPSVDVTLFEESSVSAPREALVAATAMSILCGPMEESSGVDAAVTSEGASSRLETARATILGISGQLQDPESSSVLDVEEAIRHLRARSEFQTADTAGHDDELPVSSESRGPDSEEWPNEAVPRELPENENEEVREGDTERIPDDGADGVGPAVNGAVAVVSTRHNEESHYDSPRASLRAQLPAQVAMTPSPMPAAQGADCFEGSGNGWGGDADGWASDADDLTGDVGGWGGEADGWSGDASSWGERDGQAGADGLAGRLSHDGALPPGIPNSGDGAPLHASSNDAPNANDRSLSTDPLCVDPMCVVSSSGAVDEHAEGSSVGFDLDVGHVDSNGSCLAGAANKYKNDSDDYDGNDDRLHAKPVVGDAWEAGNDGFGRSTCNLAGGIADNDEVESTDMAEASKAPARGGWEGEADGWRGDDWGDYEWDAAPSIAPTSTDHPAEGLNSPRLEPCAADARESSGPFGLVAARGGDVRVLAKTTSDSQGHQQETARATPVSPEASFHHCESAADTTGDQLQLSSGAEAAHLHSDSRAKASVRGHLIGGTVLGSAFGALSMWSAGASSVASAVGTMVLADAREGFGVRRSSNTELEGKNASSGANGGVQSSAEEHPGRNFAADASDPSPMPPATSFDAIIASSEASSIVTAVAAPTANQAVADGAPQIVGVGVGLSSFASATRSFATGVAMESASGLAALASDVSAVATVGKVGWVRGRKRTESDVEESQAQDQFASRSNASPSSFSSATLGTNGKSTNEPSFNILTGAETSPSSSRTSEADSPSEARGSPAPGAASASAVEAMRSEAGQDAGNGDGQSPLGGGVHGDTPGGKSSEPARHRFGVGGFGGNAFGGAGFGGGLDLSGGLGRLKGAGGAVRSLAEESASGFRQLANDVSGAAGAVADGVAWRTSSPPSESPPEPARAPPPPPLMPFEHWLDAGSGSAQMSAIEGVRDAAMVRVQLMLARIKEEDRQKLDPKLAEIAGRLGGEDVAAQANARSSGALEGLAVGPPPTRLREAFEESLSPMVSQLLDDIAGTIGASGPITTDSQSDDLVEAANVSSELDDPIAVVSQVQAYAARCFGELTAAALTLLRDFAASTKSEADSPAEACIGPDEAPTTAMLQGKDWPFSSETERATWLVASVLVGATAVVEAIEKVANAALEGGATLRRRAGTMAAPSSELRQCHKRLAIGVHLDAGASLALLNEAVGMLVPLLQYVTLGDAVLTGA